ncbi:MAG: GAF domain-containing sensor histidine kinase [Anaerolineales bacterium]|nr:GAF domain-containing sensor histidine kinase [Anaerolineales bacterium]
MKVAQASPNLGNEPARRVEQLSRLIEVSKLVAAQLDLDPLLQQIVDTATELVEAEMGGLLVLTEDEESFQFFKVSGWPHEPCGFPTGAGLLGLPYRQGAPLRLDDVRSHPQALGFPPYHPEVGAFLAVPLLSKGHALGELFVGNVPGGPTFSAEDEELLLAFATQAAIAIKNAHLYAHVEELARLRERQRIAQALHDTLVQMLFTVGLEAEWCINHLPLEGEARQKIQTIRRLAARSSDELRSAVFALRSRYLPGGEGLIALLQEQVAEFQAQSHIAATLIVTPQFPSLPPLVNEAVYRIVREALSNVRKHACASGVMVSLYCQADSVTVTVQDNGVGLAEPLSLEVDDSELHFGVTTMRQLTAQAQGDFFIANNDDQGVMVKARFPLPGVCL